MDRVSSYRGIAGEVVVGFLRPGILLAAVPVILYFLGIALVIGFVPGLDVFPLGAILLLLASGYAVGHYAVPARKGYFSDGWFSFHAPRGEIFAYAVRYVLALLVVLVPAAGLMYVVGGSFSSGMSMPGVAGGFSMGVGGALMLILMVVMVLGAIASYLVAASTDDIGELFAGETWSSLADRRGDVAMFLASSVGGVFTFWLIWVIPLGLIVALLTAISSGLGAAAGTFVLMLPAALSPVLIGRLSGGFALGDRQVDLQGPDPMSLAGAGPDDPAPAAPAPASAPAAESDEAPSVASTPEPAPTPTPAAAPASASATAPKLIDKGAAESLVSEIRALDASELEGKLGRAEQAYRNTPEDVGAAARFALLALHAEREDDGLQALKLAITELMAERAAAPATVLYLAAGGARTRVPLDKLTREKLGNAFRLQKRFLEAGFCFYQAWLPTNPQNAQKKLFETGTEAADASEHGQALKILQVLLKRHPDTAFKADAEAAMKRAEGELKAQQLKGG